MMQEFMLTTIDNPYNPFTHWDEWFSFDESKGYATCGLLSRFTLTSDSLSDADQAVAHNQAIDEILELNPLGIHRKITRDDVIAPVQLPV